MGGHVDRVFERGPGESGLDVGIVDDAGELFRHLDVLFVAVRADPLVPLFAVLRAQGVRIEGKLGGGAVR